MLGLMQQWPLLCHKIMDHAGRQHADREVVSRSVEGPIVRTTYGQVRRRALQVAQRLERDGYGLGDRIATLAWNTARHVEVWYGVMGIGAVYHTLNPRLFPEQIAWIINHAGDKAIFVDLTFLPLVEKLAPHLPTLQQVIVLTCRARHGVCAKCYGFNLASGEPGVAPYGHERLDAFPRQDASRRGHGGP